MKCSQCLFENRAEQRYCSRCGASLGRICGACGYSNEPHALFCGGCGISLGNGQLPSSQTARPGQSPTGPRNHAERRHLTVMFCDLVGSTALFGGLDPEEIRDVLAAYREICAEIVARFEGHIGRYLGDGVLIYFGYPQAHEDDAQRAVQAGLEIVEAMKKSPERVPRELGTVGVRIGIATGLVVVGEIASGEARDEMAVVGNTPNLAARLQALAETNSVVINETTRHLVNGLFLLKDLGPSQLKGIADPVNAFQVLGPSGAQSRFEAAVSRGLTPLVGRKEEIGILIKRWEEAKAGESQLVLVWGEAGIGKSRVLKGLETSLGSEPRYRVAHYCSPYHQNSAFYPVTEQLKRVFRFQHDDLPSDKLHKIRSGLKEIGVKPDEFAPIFAALLSVRGKDEQPSPADAQQLRMKLLNAYLAIVRQIARQRPVLMLVEDAQWIDPSTSELLVFLAEQLGSTPFLMLITSRPEFKWTWAENANATGIRLRRLSLPESEALALEVTKGKRLPDKVMQQIIEKADGFPLYIEELTKAVTESPLLRDDGDHYSLTGPLRSFAIPASLHDSLMARLDRLLPVKEIAQLASVFGRTFRRELVVAASNRSESEIDQSLDALVASGLVYRKGLEPDLTYEFKHALVADAAYHSLLRATRQHYHRAIARVLESRAPELVASQPEVIARHYVAAGEPELAIPYLRAAGLQASERSANLEAIAHFSQALELLQALPSTRLRAEQELELRIALNGPLIAAKGYSAPELEQNFTKALALCRDGSDRREVFPLRYAQWVFRITTGALTEGYELAEGFLQDAEQHRDEQLIMVGHRILGPSSFIVGKFEQARQHLEQAIAHYNPKDDHGLIGPFGQDVKAASLCYLALTLWHLGFPELAIKRAQEALEHARALRHSHTIGNALGQAGAFLHLLCRSPQAAAFAQQVSDYAAEQELPVWAAAGRFYVGWACLQQQRAQEALEPILEGMDRLSGMNFRYWRPLMLTCAAEAFCARDQRDQAMRHVDEALETADTSGEHWFDSEIHRVRGTLYQAERNDAAAEACFLRAIEVARGQGARAWELRAAATLADKWQREGRSAEAVALLGPIYQQFRPEKSTADTTLAASVLEKCTGARKASNRSRQRRPAKGTDDAP